MGLVSGRRHTRGGRGALPPVCNTDIRIRSSIVRIFGTRLPQLFTGRRATEVATVADRLQVMNGDPWVPSGSVSFSRRPYSFTVIPLPTHRLNKRANIDINIGDYVL
ncbi:hypothetical protein LSH36_656g00012 [Paralvinella palmiformis]|uniref:Uncharacterized protein n=1 Tax=Paralvinella palmiformis TaxID=53620 RepID=A0AAD9J3P6_9ANNE|nr:hypothetical protein LSH36_656g00012 [Paralvinella palmiformis]